MSSSREVYWVREDLCVFDWMCKPGSPFSQVFSSSSWLYFAFCSSECKHHWSSLALMGAPDRPHEGQWSDAMGT